jgi:hypothetical protein
VTVPNGHLETVLEIRDSITAAGDLDYHGFKQRVQRRVRNSERFEIQG